MSVFYDKIVQLCDDLGGVKISAFIENVMKMNKGAATPWQEEGRRPTRGNIVKMAAFFGVPVEYLTDDATPKQAGLGTGAVSRWGEILEARGIGESPFYIRVKQLCEQKGVTVVQMSKDVGISSQVMSAWRSGTDPTGSIVAKIAKYFGLSEKDVLQVVDVDRVYIEPDAPPPKQYDRQHDSPMLDTDNLSPISKRLLAIIEESQASTREALRDSAEKTATITKLTNSSAIVADTNAVLADTNAKLADEAIMMSKRLERFFTSKAVQGDAFDPKGKDTGLQGT